MLNVNIEMYTEYINTFPVNFKYLLYQSHL